MPVVCVRLSEEAVVALEEKAARKGQDRSAWLRDVVLQRLGMGTADRGAVEAIMPAPPQVVEPLVPGDRLRVLDPDSPVG